MSARESARLQLLRNACVAIEDLSPSSMREAVALIKERSPATFRLLRESVMALQGIKSELGGAWIRKRRKELGMNQSVLAKTVGLTSIAQVSLWENGHASPAEHHVEALVTVLGRPDGSGEEAPE